MGRPPKELDWIQIEKLCQIMCTHQEIADFCDVDLQTLQAASIRVNAQHFSEYYEQKSAHGKISLRRQQWQMALKGDRVMLIWLGKQHLGQIEKTQLSLEKIPDELFLQETQRRLELEDASKPVGNT